MTRPGGGGLPAWVRGAAGAGPGLLALTLVLAGGPAQGAASAPEVTGVVRDGRGLPVAGADVVATAVGGGIRRVAVTGPGGTFVLTLPDAGHYRLSIFTERGRQVETLVLEMAAGSRLHLALGGPQEVKTSGALAVAAPVPSLPWLTSRRLGPSALAQGRDLAGALAAVPGSPPAPALGDGPSLLGTVPGEVELRLEGLSLNDPVEGRAPWELPAALWGDIFPHAGLGPASRRDRGGAGVDLVAARATRPRAGVVAVGAGAGQPAGGLSPGQAGRPQGRAFLGFAEARAEITAAGGERRGSLAVAPTRGAWQADPTSAGAARGRRTSVMPVLARGDAELGGWTLTGLGLLLQTRQQFERAGGGGSILMPEEPTARRHDLALAGLVARRALGFAPTELTLTAGLLASGRREQPLIGPELRTGGRRLTLAAALRGGGELGGQHVLSATAGLEADAADRSAAGGASFASRQAGQALIQAEAASYTPYFALDERYRPLPGLEIEAGLRAEKILLRAEGRTAVLVPFERSFSTDMLWAPRAGVVYLPSSRPGWSQSRLHATAGRFGGRLPLAPLLDLTGSPPFGIGVPAEDVGMAGADLVAGGLSLSVTALERRLAHPVEDRFSPSTGQLELHTPRSARRRYRAIWAELRAELAGVRGAVAVIRSSLRGNHLGWLDRGSGVTRPGATEAFDTGSSEVNRQGPLPLDRRYGLRCLLEHGRWVGRSLRLDGALAARLDQGTPREAQAPNPDSPLGRVYLVEPGSLGRTGAVAAVDAAVELSWLRKGVLGSLRLEVLNLGDRRRAVTRDPLYTDVVVTPAPGARGRPGLAAALDAGGSPVAARAAHDAPVALAELLTVRLVLALSF